MEHYFCEQADQESIRLGIIVPTMKNHKTDVPESQNSEEGGNDEESSPSYVSSNEQTPSYTTSNTSFDFEQKCNINSEEARPKERNAAKRRTLHALRRETWFESSQLRESLSSERLEDLKSNKEEEGYWISQLAKMRKNSADNTEKLNISKGNTFARLLRRTQSAGCTKDIPAHSQYLKEKKPVSKTKSADCASTVNREDGEEKKQKKTLAQDMKLRLTFLRRRHTDSSLQHSVRPSPEEAQKWADSFQELMSSKYGQALFRAFLSREFSEENIEFWLACEDFKKTRSNKLSSKARKIYEDFVAIQAPKEVNLDHTIRNTIMNNLETPDHHSFDQAQRRVQGLMEQDSYLRFLQSELYLELIQCNDSR